MNIEELATLADWLDDALNAIIPAYTNLAQILQHNATQPQKQQLEPALNELFEKLSLIDLNSLTNAQASLLQDMKILHLLGQDGISFTKSLIMKSDFDPATAYQDITKAVNSLQSAHKWANAVRQALSGLRIIKLRTHLEESSALLRIEFRGDASINDIYNLRDWSRSWYEIIRGAGMLHDQPPEETKVVSATTGSIIIDLAAAVPVTYTLALIATHAETITKKILDIYRHINQMKLEGILNKELKNALTSRIEELKNNGVEETVSHIKKELKIKPDGEKENALRSSVEKFMEFRTKGGEIDFVMPQKMGEEGEESGATDKDLDLVKELKRKVNLIRQIKSEIKMIEQDLSSKETPDRE